MQSDRSPHAVLTELAGHPKGDDLARLVHTIAFAAADEHRTTFSDGLEEAASRAGISREDAETSFGNVLRALEKAAGEGAGPAARVLLATLLARGVALSPPRGPEAEERVVEAMLWIAAHTPLDPLASIDAAMGTEADGLWLAVASAVRRAELGSPPIPGRAETLVAAAALRASTNLTARAEANALAGEARDPVVRALLREGEAREPQGAPTAARGELVPPPRNVVALALLGVTGILAVMHLGRLVGRLVLGYRRPAELRVTPRGLTVIAKTELLGRTLRNEEVHVPIESLLRASREVRYPQLASYAGILALALGSYAGISFAVDGARAGSPELLGLGALLVALGVTLDFVVANVAAKTKGRCRVVIVPRKGRPVAVGELDPAVADAALHRLMPSG
jgi:hypothetical protein